MATTRTAGTAVAEEEGDTETSLEPATCEGVEEAAVATKATPTIRMVVAEEEEEVVEVAGLVEEISMAIPMEEGEEVEEEAMPKTRGSGKRVRVKGCASSLSFCLLSIGESISSETLFVFGTTRVRCLYQVVTDCDGD